MNPGQPFYRFALWLSVEDRPFHIMLWTCCPALMAIMLAGWIGAPA